MPEQIVIVGAGVPGAPNSYYSELIDLVANGDGSSPPIAEYTLIPQIGFIMFSDLAATLSVVLRTDDSPESFVTIIAAGSQGLIWSDGSNCFLQNTASPASPELEAHYWVLAQKP